MDRTSTITGALLSAALLLTAPAIPAVASGAYPDRTGAECHLVASGREGRVWLPWSRLTVPGARIETARVSNGLVDLDRPEADADHRARRVQLAD